MVVRRFRTTGSCLRSLSLFGLGSEFHFSSISPPWQNLHGKNSSGYVSLSGMLESPHFHRLSSNVSSLKINRECHLRVVDRRLAQQTKLLKERNGSLLRAVSTVKGNPSSSTVFVAGTNDECVHYILHRSMH